MKPKEPKEKIEGKNKQNSDKTNDFESSAAWQEALLVEVQEMRVIGGRFQASVRVGAFIPYFCSHLLGNNYLPYSIFLVD